MPRGGRVAPAVSRTREAEAWALVQQGVSQAQIAEQLHVTPAAVTKMLQRVERRVLAELAANVERLKARQHARIEHIYGEAMAAWKQSQQPRKRSRSVKTIAPHATPAPANVVVREETLSEAQTGDGNAALLLAALQALADQRKLWGFDAPARVRVRDDTPQRRPLEHLSDEDLRAHAAELDALLEGDVDAVSVTASHRRQLPERSR